MVSTLFLTGVVWGSVAVVAGSAVLAWRQRPKPGATAFAVVMVAATWWVTTASIGLFTTDRALSVFWWKVEWTGIVFLPVAWLAFALIYTGRSEYVSRLSVAALSALPTVTLALVVTNGLAHGLVAGPPTFHPAGSMLLMERSFGPWLWVHIAYTYLLLAAGTALLVGMVAKRRLLYRGQAVALLLVVAAPWFGSAVYLSALSPVPYFDPTPYTFVISGAAGIAALSQLAFLDAVPVTNRVARRSVVENVDAGVVVADTDGHVVDTNPRARQLLDCDEATVTGDPVDDWLPAAADDIAAAGRSARGDTGDAVGANGDRTDTGPGPVSNAHPDSEGDIVVDDRGARTRYLDVRVTELRDDYDNVTGRIFLIRDVTARRTRLQRLGVLNRVLRHNLRNEVNVIYGHADRLARGDGDPETVAADIRAKASELTTLANKARQIDGALGRGDAESTELAAVVTIECDRVAAANPAVDLSVTTPDAELLVDAVAGTVVRNLVENAVEHNTASDPTVAVTVTADLDCATVTVTDNGPGIPPGELAALDGDIETQLDHASGLGLWLVKWGVEGVGGTLSFEDRDPSGSRVTVTFPRVDDAVNAEGDATVGAEGDGTVDAVDGEDAETVAGGADRRTAEGTDENGAPTAERAAGGSAGENADPAVDDPDGVGENAGLLNLPFLKL